MAPDGMSKPRFTVPEGWAQGKGLALALLRNYLHVNVASLLRNLTAWLGVAPPPPPAVQVSLAGDLRAALNTARKCSKGRDRQHHNQHGRYAHLRERTEASTTVALYDAY